VDAVATIFVLSNGSLSWLSALRCVRSRYYWMWWAEAFQFKAGHVGLGPGPALGAAGPRLDF